MNVYIIAEAGVNHNGSLEKARLLVEAAADAGADAVKFQTFRATELATPTAAKADYQKVRAGADETQFEMLRRLELAPEAHVDLQRHAAACGIDFLSTPFDPLSLHFLVDGLGMQTVKIPSGEITNAPFLLEIAATACRLILSTGMSTLADVEAALGVLAFGMCCPNEAPVGERSFAAAYRSTEGQRQLLGRVSLLHCTTEYPTPIAEVNLRAMDTLHAAFGLPVGYSDHTAGVHIPVAAVARGATIIEKHFTLDRNLPGPDHQASLETAELTAMVAAIREVEAAIGDGRKIPLPGELPNLGVARRSLVAAKPIAVGELLTADNVVVRRPGHGISPMRYWDVIGHPAARAYGRDEPLEI